MYNSAKEIMEALLAGKKIRNTIWGKDDYLYMKKGKLLAPNDEENKIFELNLYYSWEEYVEKPKKCYLYKITSNEYQDSYLVSASSKKEARQFLYNELKKLQKDDDDIDVKDVLSVKLSTCEKIKLQSNIVLTSTTGLFDYL